MIAKNNIFNIRATSEVWQGQVGQRRGFVEFQTEKMAVRAWLKLMKTYREKHGLDTIEKIVNRFAPPSENNTQAYITFLATNVHKAADQPLESHEDYARLGAAMAWYETNTRYAAMRVYEMMKQTGIYIPDYGDE